ncbi:MAG TPA: CYTH and CHAD domain-containing protein [Candidatus Methylomirabilis sp.]|nr:CYTH and CHAD domain-containing protein [Candidatus Methylomirabilis sp.]
MKEPNERTLTYDVGAAFRLPQLPGTPLTRRAFVSTYYDTPDLRLARHGTTVLRRMERRKSRWQVKLARGVARLDVELPGAAGPPPEAINKILLAYARGAELLPVATLAARRSGVLVRDLDSPVAEVVLERVSVLEDGHVAQQFREIEVRLIGHDEDVLQRLGALLEGSGAKPTATRPKLFRALGLDLPEAPPSPDARAPAADHIKAMMRVQLEAIRAHDPGTRLGTDPEDLHKMRTSIRRLRAILRAARPLFAAGWGEELRSELDWLGTALGVVRDFDVLLGSLRAEIAAFESAERTASRRIVDRLSAERTRARVHLQTVLEDPRYLALLDRLEEFIEQHHEPAAPISLADIATAEFKKLRKAVEKLPEEPTDSNLHAVRIKAKRARYAAELAQASVGRSAERFLTKVRTLQDILGEHQDAVVAEERLRALLDGARGRRTAFVAGRLVEQQHWRRLAARQAFVERWPKVERRGRKAWG